MVCSERRSKLGKRSSQKGNRGGRVVANMCQKWWRQLEEDAEFMKTPRSGGWGTVKVRAHFRACADIMTTAEKWPFVTEVKWREDWSYPRFIDAKPTPAWKWWVKACKDARDQNGVAMMWLKKNSINKWIKFPWLVVMPASYAEGRSIPEPGASWAVGTFSWLPEVAEVPEVWKADELLRTPPERFLIGG